MSCIQKWLKAEPARFTRLFQVAQRLNGLSTALLFQQGRDGSDQAEWLGVHKTDNHAMREGLRDTPNESAGRLEAIFDHDTFKKQEQHISALADETSVKHEQVIAGGNKCIDFMVRLRYALNSIGFALEFLRR